jgi:hypothetical protein
MEVTCAECGCWVDRGVIVKPIHRRRTHAYRQTGIETVGIVGGNRGSEALAGASETAPLLESVNSLRRLGVRAVDRAGEVSGGRSCDPPGTIQRRIADIILASRCDIEPPHASPPGDLTSSVIAGRSAVHRYSTMGAPQCHEPPSR